MVNATIDYPNYAFPKKEIHSKYNKKNLQMHVCATGIPDLNQSNINLYLNRNTEILSALGKIPRQSKAVFSSKQILYLLK